MAPVPVGCCIAFITIIGLNLLFGQRLLGGSGDDAGVPLRSTSQGLDSVTLDPFIAVTLPVLLGLSVFSLIQRFRRSTGVERDGLKWVAFGLPLSVVLFVLSMAAGNETLLGSVLGGAAYLVFPVTIGIDILRVPSVRPRRRRP